MIRILTAGDTEIYKDLRLKSLKTDPLSFLSTYEAESGYDITYFRQKIENVIRSPFYGVYGYFENGKMIAFAQLAHSFYHNKRHLCYLNEVYVDPGYRKKGIAGKLIRYLIEKAGEEKSLEQIQLRVNSQNTKAISLYKKLGFEKISVLKNAVKNPDGTYQDECFFNFFL